MTLKSSIFFLIYMTKSKSLQTHLFFTKIELTLFQFSLFRCPNFCILLMLLGQDTPVKSDGHRLPRLVIQVCRCSNMAAAVRMTFYVMACDKKSKCIYMLTVLQLVVVLKEVSSYKCRREARGGSQKNVWEPLVYTDTRTCAIENICIYKDLVKRRAEIRQCSQFVLPSIIGFLAT